MEEIMKQIKDNQKKNRMLLITLFSVIILMLGVIIYLLIIK
jgi:hypothetical protein